MFLNRALVPLLTGMKRKRSVSGNFVSRSENYIRYLRNAVGPFSVDRGGVRVNNG